LPWQNYGAVGLKLGGSLEPIKPSTFYPSFQGSQCQQTTHHLATAGFLKASSNLYS